MKRLALCLLTLCLAPAAASAEADAPLARYLPSDAVVYVGWAGAEAVADQYAGTRAEALLAESGLADLATRYVPQLLDALAREQPDAAPYARAVGEIAAIAWRRPTAFAFGGVDWESELLDGEPAPKLAFVCDAGDDAALLRARLVQLFTEMKRPEIVTLVDERDGRVYLTLAYSHMDLAALDGEAAGSLADTGPFAEKAGPVLDSLGKGAAVVTYVSVPRLLQVGYESIAREDGPDAADQAKRAAIALGLDGLGSLVSAGGFDGRDYASAALVEVAADRRGLTRLLPEPGAALDESALSAVPGDSTMVAAGQLRLGVAVDVVRQLVAEFDPDAAVEFEQGVGVAGMFAGADVERNLLGQFGDTWAAFVSPRVGDSILSGVVVNPARDPDLLRRALQGLSLNAAALANSNLRDETDGLVRVPGRTYDFGGESPAYFLNAPAVAPAWAVDDGRLWAAFYPQNLKAARGLDGPSFAESEAYRAAVELCDGNAPAFLAYADLPAMAPRSYPNLLTLAQLLTGTGDLFGDRLRANPPAVVLPPLPTVREQLAPAVSAGWVDAQGLHFRGREPFPLSGLLADTGGGSGGLFQLLGALGPAFEGMGRADEIEVEEVEAIEIDDVD